MWGGVSMRTKTDNWGEHERAQLNGNLCVCVCVSVCIVRSGTCSN